MLRQDAIAIFLAGVEAVKPGHFIPHHIQFEENRIRVGDQHIPVKETGGLYIAAVGKAASAMALETEKIFNNHITEGLVITKYDHALSLTHCHTIEAGHPVPDNNSLLGSEALIRLFKKAKPTDTIILLISGGASALITDVPRGCNLPDIQQTVQLLLSCGASIDEMNTVRKHLSDIKGGQLMQYTRARVIALLLSDVPGDDLSVIASGLTVPDETTFGDAWHIIEKYALAESIPACIKNRLLNGMRGSIPETPKPGDPAFLNVYNFLVASNQNALDAAAQKAQSLGYATTILSPMLTGDAEIQAATFISRLKNEKHDSPLCLLWGGETTVTVKGTGKGGRNQHLALAALCEIRDRMWLQNHRVTILSGGTDGTDGPTTAAGAVIDADIFNQADKLSLNPEVYLHNNDAYHFFEKTGGLIITGPTQTNVMDIIIGLSD